MHQRVQAAVEAGEPQAEAVRQAQTFLTQVACPVARHREHYLAQVPRPSLDPDPQEASPPAPGSEVVQQELEKMFADLEQQAAAGFTAQRLLSKWDAMSQTWLPGILHCYDIPGLPLHNLELEGIFGGLRRHQRRVSGRKETTPLRIFGPGEIMFLALEDEEVLPWLQAVPPEEYWSQRRRQEEREEPQRWLRRLRRDPVRALTQVDDQFYEVVKVQIRAPPVAPDHS